MRFRLTPRPLLHLITTILLSARPIAANPHPLASVTAGFSYDKLLARWDCSGQLCGWNDQLCCSAGSACYTDSNNEAQCGASSYAPVNSYAPASSYHAGGGYWQVYTTTYVRTDLETITTVISSYVGGSVSAAASASGARCNYALNESPCGNICCAGNQYCAYVGQCAAAYKGQTTTTAGSSKAGGALPPVRGTSASNVYVTETKSPSTTVAFQTPVATGANVTMTSESQQSGGGGLSGGAIAGIVIGVLVGLALLALLCFYCCVKGLLDGCLALFGIGRDRRRTTEVTEYERRHHHGHGGGGGRTWYGASKPSRVERRDKDAHGGRNLLGIGAGLAGLWAILGLKRRNQKKHDKHSEYSYSSDYYTSSSE